jgi:serine O-acetyltransferase
MLFLINYYVFRLFRRIFIIKNACEYLLRIIWSCHIPLDLKIGKNFKVGYNGLGVVIHNRSVIGDNCLISQNVTIGGTSGIYGVPVIGNNVYIGAGACIIGDIKIGNNVIVGANAVVTKDVPNDVVIAGVPARIIKSNKIVK